PRKCKKRTPLSYAAWLALMNSSKLPSTHVVIIRPSSCHSSRKRSHLRASRNKAQFSTISRIVSLSKSSFSLAIASPSVEQEFRARIEAKSVDAWGMPRPAASILVSLRGSACVDKGNNVAYWRKADILVVSLDVCFRGQIGKHLLV